MGIDNSPIDCLQDYSLHSFKGKPDLYKNRPLCLNARGCHSWTANLANGVPRYLNRHVFKIHPEFIFDVLNLGKPTLAWFHDELRVGHRGTCSFRRVKDVHLTEGPPSLKIHRLKTRRTERHFTRQLHQPQLPRQHPNGVGPAATAAAAPPPNGVSMLSTRPRTNEVCQFGVLAMFGVSTAKLPQQVLFASHLHQPTWVFLMIKALPLSMINP